MRSPASFDPVKAMKRVLGLRHERFARGAAWSGEKADDVSGHARLIQNINEDCGDGRRIARRLHHHRVSRDDGSHRHAAHNRRRKIPRRNHDADAERNIFEIVFFAVERGQFLRSTQAQRLASIVFAEIDQLGDVRIGFRPGLANFVAQPRVEFEAPLAQNVCRAIDAGYALFHRDALPAFERRMRLFHGLVSHLHGRFLEHADHLIGVRWIVRLDLFGGGDALAANRQRILAAEHAAHLCQSRFHSLAVFRLGEIDECLVGKFAALQIHCGFVAASCSGGCHKVAPRSVSGACWKAIHFTAARDGGTRTA